jgi:hypothetical protein
LAATEEGEGVVVEDTNDALALRIGIEVDATTGFLFFFSATNYEWACIVWLPRSWAAQYQHKWRLSHDRGLADGLGTWSLPPLAPRLALPNRFRDIGGVVSVKSGGDCGKLRRASGNEIWCHSGLGRGERRRQR